MQARKAQLKRKLFSCFQQLLNIRGFWSDRCRILRNFVALLPANKSVSLNRQNELDLVPVFNIQTQNIFEYLTSECRNSIVYVHAYAYACVLLRSKTFKI